MQNFYDILGISKEATEDDIKTAFRKLAHKHHPDKKGGDEAKFKEASEAYAVLSDKKKRAEYDTYGKTFAGGHSGGGQGGFGGFGDFDFSNFQGFQGFGGQGGNVEFDIGDVFGDLFGGSQKARSRGRDISIDIELSFREGIFGVKRRILIAKISECTACGGSGAKKSSKMIVCSGCGGKGAVRETRSSFFGSFTSSRTCARCHGIGKVPEIPCEMCRGEGVVKRQEEIHVSVPAGVSDGEMIRMPSMGEAAPGGGSGDLYIKLHIKNDPNFSREGNDLTTVLPVKLTDALLGREYKIHSLDGEEVAHVPAGIVHGETLRIRGKGVPYGRGTRGDLLARIEIEFPKKLSRTARELIEKLRQEGL